MIEGSPGAAAISSDRRRQRCLLELRPGAAAGKGCRGAAALPNQRGRTTRRTCGLQSKWWGGAGTLGASSSTARLLAIDTRTVRTKNVSKKVSQKSTMINARNLTSRNLNSQLLLAHCCTTPPRSQVRV